MPARSSLLRRPDWAPRWVPSIDDDQQLTILRWLLTTVLVAGLGTCVVQGADSPDDPELGAPVATASDLAGRFGTVLVELVTETGEVLELCLLHADEGAERSRGLMQVTDLEGHDGMLFSNQAPVEHPFVMINTAMPLEITWWQEDGSYLSSAEMIPCNAGDPADCPRYPAGGPYRYAIEVPQGSLEAAGIGPSSELRVGPQGCTPA